MLCLLFCLPALWAGLMGDDYIHYALLSETPPLAKPNDLSLFGLFSFIDGDPGRSQILKDFSLVPWWTLAELKYAFWRPFSEFTHWLDYQLWPNQPLMMHLQSLVWYLLAIFMISHLFGRMISSASAALVALTVFALDSSHGFALGWLSNRNGILALCFTVLTLTSYINWRRSGKTQHLMLSIYGLVLGLLSAEAAIAAFGYVVAYALFIDKKGPWRGLGACTPLLAVIVLWWVSYKWMGFGAANADAYYVDPVASPGTFLSSAIERLPVLMASLWGIIPAELYGFSGQTNWLYVGFCVLLSVALLAPVFLVLGLHAKVMFWFFGMLFAMLPTLAALPHDRLLLIPSIGAAGLLGETLHFLFFRRARPLNKLASRYATVVGGLLVGFHMILSPLLLPLMAYSPNIWARMVPEQPTVFNAVKDIEQKQLVLFGTPLASSVAIAPLRFFRDEPLPERVWTITTLDDDIEFRVIDLHNLEITNSEGFIRGIEKSIRDLEKYPLVQGQSIPLTGLEIEVKALNEQGHPTTLMLTFSRPLNSENLVFLRWHPESKQYEFISLPLS